MLYRGAPASAARIAVRTKAAENQPARVNAGGMGATVRARPDGSAGYQAWGVPQCGQLTEVDTSASKT